MTLAFVVLQEPEGPAPQLVNMAVVRAKQLSKAYLILVDVPALREVQFIDYLDGFLSKSLPACRRDRNLIFTSKTMSFDPVQRIIAWAGDWIGAPVAATPL